MCHVKVEVAFVIFLFLYVIMLSCFLLIFLFHDGKKFTKLKYFICQTSIHTHTLKKWVKFAGTYSRHTDGWEGTAARSIFDFKIGGVGILFEK